MRLFTAIDLPDAVLDNLTGLIERLKPAARIKWSPRTNLHITTKFIGEWPEDRLPELQQALGGLAGRTPFPIQIRNLGYYPNPHSPRVFFAGIEAPPGLPELARDIDGALEAIGIEPEKRPYSPHLTLARIKDPVPLQKLRQAVASLDSLEFGAFSTDRFYLYQSRTNPAGSVYTKLSEFPLSK